MCSLSLSLALIEIDCCECYDLKTLGRRLMMRLLIPLVEFYYFFQKENKNENDGSRGGHVIGKGEVILFRINGPFDI